VLDRVPLPEEGVLVMLRDEEDGVPVVLRDAEDEPPG
jgi:hypothetical protein